MEMLDRGKTEEGLSILEEATKLDPRNAEYAIRAGQVHFQQGNYEQARDLAYPWTRKRRSDPRAWQLYGNSLDLLGNAALALDAYNAGIKKHPRAGFLYMEKGIVAWEQGDQGSALTYWETGIAQQPGFSGNYYWASKGFAVTQNYLWAAIFGELFLNLERGTERTEEISRLLYETYQAAIVGNADSLKVIDFMPEVTGTEFDRRFEETFDRSYLPGNAPVSMAQLHSTRNLFLSHWFEESHRYYPNALFEWQRKLQMDGRLEAYDYWLFFDGDQEEFAAWQSTHREALAEFEEWFTWNKLTVDYKSWPARK